MAIPSLYKLFEEERQRLQILGKILKWRKEPARENGGRKRYIFLLPHFPFWIKARVNLKKNMTSLKHNNQSNTFKTRVNCQDKTKKYQLTQLLLFAVEVYETDAKVHWMCLDPKSTIYRHGFGTPRPCLFPKPERSQCQIPLFTFKFHLS